MSFDIVSVRPIYQGWGRFMTAKVRLPDGSVADRQIEDHGTSVAVLPYDVERKVALLVRQPRTAATFASGSHAEEMLEAVAGRLEDGAEDKDEARREAQEEVGVDLLELERVASVWSSPEVSTERVSLFLAAYTERDRTSAGGGLEMEGESITVVELALVDLAAMADTGRLLDMKTMLLVQTLRLKRPDLFRPVQPGPATLRSR